MFPVSLAAGSVDIRSRAMLEDQFLVILMEYASGGELYELMLSRGQLAEVHPGAVSARERFRLCFCPFSD
ncbi:hypothetical protein CYMTET_34880, partial [Cymbomonas tetramitiformis]